MIQTTIKNLSKNHFTGNLQKALDFFIKNQESITTQAVGKYEVDPSFFYMIQEYDSKTEVKWEAHKKYIDVQIILNGEESMKVADIEHLTALGEFNPEKDFQGYEGVARTHIDMTAGDLVVFFPYDAHQPGWHSKNGVSPVRKCVIKVLV